MSQMSNPVTKVGTLSVTELCGMKTFVLLYKDSLNGEIRRAVLQVGDEIASQAMKLIGDRVKIDGLVNPMTPNNIMVNAIAAVPPPPMGCFDPRDYKLKP
jgi:hypothetical protein